MKVSWTGLASPKTDLEEQEFFFPVENVWAFKSKMDTSASDYLTHCSYFPTGTGETLD